MGSVDGTSGTLVWRTTGDRLVIAADLKQANEVDRWREWKRDPSFLRGPMPAMGGLFFSGSPVPPDEAWSIGRVTQLNPQPPYVFQKLLAKAGTFETTDLLAPNVQYGAGVAGGAWGLWYAAVADPQKPDYVTQIGVATSPDGTTWTRRPAPVVAAQPAQPGPASHGATDPSVLLLGGNMVVMYYAGLSCENEKCRYQILRAVSQDGGLNFGVSQVVLSGRDGVAEEAGGVAGPSAVLHEDAVYLAYTALSEMPQKSWTTLRRSGLSGTIGLMISSDKANGTMFKLAHGKKPLVGRDSFYNTRGSSGPSLYVEDGKLHLYFAGFNDAGVSIAHASLVQVVE